MRSPLRILMALALAIGVSWPAGAAAEVEEEAWAALARPGSVAILRHALAPGTGDPADFTLGDCSTQRNLSAEGRAQARLIGAAFAARGIAVDRILTSQWCRCRDTASEMAREMGDVPIEDLPPLNSFFGNRGRGAAQTAATLEFLRAAGDEEKLVLVSHFVNARALTGVGTSSGEIVVFRLDEAGEVEVLGEILIQPPA